MTPLPHTWLARLDRSDPEQAERFHRALLLPETLCSDPEIDRLVATSQLLCPGVAMGEAARARGLRMMLRAIEVEDGVDGAGSKDDDQPEPGSQDHRLEVEDLGAVTYVVDTGGLGMLKLADVETIDHERAQQAAMEVAELMAQAKARAAR